MGLPSDSLAAHFPVSIKGVVFREDRVILLRNERDEWELPGGKLELGEAPEVCCAREILEELALAVSVERLLRRAGARALADAGRLSGVRPALVETEAYWIR